MHPFRYLQRYRFRLRRLGRCGILLERRRQLSYRSMSNLCSGIGEDDDVNDVASSSGETSQADSTFKRTPPPTGDGDTALLGEGVGVS